MSRSQKEDEKKEIAVVVYGSGYEGMDSGTDIHEAVHTLGNSRTFKRIVSALSICL